MSDPAAVTSLSRSPQADVRRGAERRADRAGLRPVPLLGAAVLVGLAWGAATSGLQTVLPWPFAGLANAVGPWVAPAFLVGAWSRRPWAAVLAGVLVCLGEVTGYYATSALRGFGVNLPTVLVWAATGLLGGPVLGLAGWCWRRAQSPKLAALGAALLGGVFLAEGAVTFAYVLGYVGDAVVFCTLGTLLVVGLGATAPAARAGRARGAGSATAWLPLVLPLGVAGELALHAMLG